MNRIDDMIKFASSKLVNNDCALLGISSLLDDSEMNLLKEMFPNHRITQGNFAVNTDDLHVIIQI